MGFLRSFFKSSGARHSSRVPQVSGSPATGTGTLWVRWGEDSILRPGNRAPWARFAGPALILFAAAIASAPIWTHGPAGGDDFEFHFVSWLDAQQSWRQAIPYPHWGPSANFGAGEPRFVFYPPLTWMLGAALGLVLPWTLVPVAMTFLLLASTGLATRALARQALAEAPATLAGCVALSSGYALFTTYNRTAYGELAGGCWIPLLLLFILRDRDSSAAAGRRALDGSVLPLALVLAACWLSDAPLGVLASYLLAAVALAASLAARSWAPVLRASVAAPLGIALSALYLIPAAWEQRWVDILQAAGVRGDQGLRIENNWLFPHHGDPVLHMRDVALHFVSPIAVSMIAVAALSLAALWARRKLVAGSNHRPAEESSRADQPLARAWWIPLALIPAAVLLLQLPVSLPIWNLLPKLRFLQFPWRWVLAVEAPMAIFFAAAVWPRKSSRPWQRAAVAALCALVFLASIVFAAKNFFRDPPEDTDLADLVAVYYAGTGFVGSDEYQPPGAENSLVATGVPDACLTDDFNDELGVPPTPQDVPVWRPEQQSCISTSTATIRQAEHWRLSTVARRACFLVLRLRSYPAWRIRVNGQLVNNLPARDDGLIAVPVREGPVDLAIDWTTTPDAIAGRSVSALALVALIGVALLERKLAQPLSRPCTNSPSEGRGL